MTALENSIRIEAAPADVWSVLSSLDTLENYDPGVKRSEIISSSKEGPGTTRRCELTPRGWFTETITDWIPQRSLTIELSECTLPLKRLRHTYTLEMDEHATLVRQRMDYELKYGPLGKLMDSVMVRRKWDAGIKAFFSGLKRYVETGEGKRA